MDKYDAPTNEISRSHDCPIGNNGYIFHTGSISGRFLDEITVRSLCLRTCACARCLYFDCSHIIKTSTVCLYFVYFLMCFACALAHCALRCLHFACALAHCALRCLYFVCCGLVHCALSAHLLIVFCSHIIKRLYFVLKLPLCLYFVHFLVCFACALAHCALRCLHFVCALAHCALRCLFSLYITEWQSLYSDVLGVTMCCKVCGGNSYHTSGMDISVAPIV